MKKLIGEANPDNISLTNENGQEYFYIGYENTNSFPFIYGENNDEKSQLFIGDFGSTHRKLEKSEPTMAVKFIEGRLFYTQYGDFLTVWSLDVPYVKKYLASCVNEMLKRGIMDSNTILLFSQHRPQNVVGKNSYNQNIYILGQIPVPELLFDVNTNDIKAKNTSKERELHLMSPIEKQKMINNTPELKKQKEDYYDESGKSWTEKYGNIDPAKYHLLMYQESKKPIKITKEDISLMVKDCVNFILENKKKI